MLKDVLPIGQSNRLAGDYLNNVHVSRSLYMSPTDEMEIENIFCLLYPKLVQVMIVFLTSF